MKLRSYFLSYSAVLVATTLAFSQTPSPTPSASPAPPATAAVPATPTAAQTATAQPTFDVASIKPSVPLDYQKLAADFQAGKMPRLGPHVDGSPAEYFYMTLKDLIVTAYNVKAYQVDGPTWLGDTHYDVEAKMPDGSKKDDAPAMLQSLLADRFKLAVHRDNEEHKVLALVVGKSGPKMKESPTAPADIDPNAPLQPGERKIDTNDGPVIMKTNSNGSMTFNMGKKGTFSQKFDLSSQSMHIDASAMTMDGFADMLTNMMQMGGNGGPQVVDMTGLKGNYEVSVDLSIASLMAAARAQMGGAPGPSGGGSTPANAPADAASDPTGGNNVASSLEQMGLKLDERKAMVERLVVDHAEKTPTAD
jgi:uncharacterized protein (TIGR03435 family)